jgi:hypothetical protein
MLATRNDIAAPSPDPLRFLPDEPREKLVRLLDIEAAEHGAISAIGERIREAAQERAHWARILDPRFNGANLPDSRAGQETVSRAVAQERFDDANGTVERLTEQRAVLEAGRTRTGHRCAAYVRQVSEAIATANQRALRNGEGEQQTTLPLAGPVAIPKDANREKIAAQITALLAQVKDAETRPRHSFHRVAEAEALVDRLAARGTAAVAEYVSTGRLNLPQHRVSEPLNGFAANLPPVSVATGFEVPDGHAFACWLNPDAVKAALRRDIEALTDDVDAITDEERADLLAHLNDGQRRRRQVHPGPWRCDLSRPRTSRPLVPPDRRRRP